MRELKPTSQHAVKGCDILAKPAQQGLRMKLNALIYNAPFIIVSLEIGVLLARMI
jgi:hypothetical protein